MLWEIQIYHGFQVPQSTVLIHSMDYQWYKSKKPRLRGKLPYPTRGIDMGFFRLDAEQNPMAVLPYEI